MSESIKHECGLAYVRLLKPLTYYEEKYGTGFYGLQKLHFLMEKQKNRGQDGAGIGVLKLNVPFGESFFKRLRYSGGDAIDSVFDKIKKEWTELRKLHTQIDSSSDILLTHSDFAGEVLMGHLRYATQGLNNVKFCHPFTIAAINPSQNIALAGNFNLVNTEELLHFLGMKPRNIMSRSDLNAMIHVISQFLNEEVEKNAQSPDLKEVLKKSCELFDGGYVCGGQIGNGDSFIMRDKNGIRPAFYYQDEEVIVAASERIAIMTCFDVEENIKEIPPGHALIVKASGEFSVDKVAEPAAEITPCSFERIYFSRGNDPDIYKERIQLGRNVVPSILKTINHDTERVVFSYIPNTGETAFYGMLKGLQEHLDEQVTSYILHNKNPLSLEEVTHLLAKRICSEKLIHKDIKTRTFITDDFSRDELVNQVYDTTQGILKKGEETIVLIDDSIVRGTTLKNSVIRILNRLNPKKIVIISSAPQIRYPDCYGIDMSKLEHFIAFRAAVSLLKEQDMEFVIEETYQRCKLAQLEERLHEQNYVQAIYQRFNDEEISNKVSEMLRPEELSAELVILFQTIEGLHQACPNNKGDWYFTGNYPTQGGIRVANTAFINYYEGNSERAY